SLPDLLEPVFLAAAAALQRQVLRGLHLAVAQLLRARLERGRDRERLPEGVHRVQVAPVLVIEVAERAEHLERLRPILELLLHLIDRGQERLRIVRVQVGQGAGIGRGPRRLLPGAGESEGAGGRRGAGTHGSGLARRAGPVPAIRQQTFGKGSVGGGGAPPPPPSSGSGSGSALRSWPTKRTPARAASGSAAGGSAAGRASCGG